MEFGFPKNKGRVKQQCILPRKILLSDNKWKNFTSKLGEMTRTHTNNRMQEKLNNTGVKDDNQENITKKPK